VGAPALDFLFYAPVNSLNAPLLHDILHVKAKQHPTDGRACHTRSLDRIRGHHLVLDGLGQEKPVGRVQGFC
jgi:hypothetical protein